MMDAETNQADPVGTADAKAMLQADWLRLHKENKRLSEAMDADEHEKLVAAVNNLVEIVEGVRNVLWAYDQWRLKDTPEWCAMYSAWSKPRASIRRSNDKVSDASDATRL